MMSDNKTRNMLTNVGRSWVWLACVFCLTIFFGCVPQSGRTNTSTSNTTTSPPTDRDVSHPPETEAEMVADIEAEIALPAAKPADQPAAPPAGKAAAEKTGSKTPHHEKPLPKKETPLIPRRVFFGNPEKARARISPDGARLAYLAPVDDVLNVWVGKVDDLAAAKPITQDTHRGIRTFYWAYTSRHILYVQDNDGDENFHLYAVDLDSGDIRDLTPFDDIAARVEGVSEKFPEEILVGVNDRDNHQLHDIYRINIATGERKLLQLNPGFAGFMADDDYHIRFAVTFTPDAGQLYLTPDGEKWKEFLKIGSVDAMTTNALGFDASGEKLYFLDSRNRDTAALKLLDIKTGDEELLAENAKADISGAMTHPTKKHVQAVTYTYDRRKWIVLDDSIQADLDYLKTVADGEIQITSRTLDDQTWTVAYIMDDGPVRFYLYDRPKKEAAFLFTSNPELENLPLVKMHSEIIPSRDGLELVSYLSLPAGSDAKTPGRPDQPLPLVLLVHGGPWARDSWGYNSQHQLLANRGYAVLSVNYRGSTGLGKEFINAANREWAAKMHNDLVDAVDWAVEQGVAQREKVAIMGGSYGGYATLVGLTFTPDLFTCGVDIVGPSNLVTLLQNPPPYWMPFMPVMKLRVGDYSTEEGREFLRSRSPLFFVDKINQPLLIGQGAKDPRVKQAEADQIVAAMNEKKIPVTYMLFQEEGHGFARPENRFAFYAVTEAFLAQHLGGRYEPIGDAFSGAVFTIPSGQNGAPGLEAALQAKE